MKFYTLIPGVPVSCNCPECGQMWVRDYGPLNPCCQRCGHQKPHVTEVGLEWSVARVTLKSDGSWRAEFNYRFEKSRCTSCVVADGGGPTEALANAISLIQNHARHVEARKLDAEVV